MIGQTISHYKILEKLGEGGMGVVYKAQDTRLDRFVALKFLPHHLTANETEKARFLQEAKAASALNHPNVCTIYGIEEHDGQQFIEMEFVDGVTLREKLPVEKLNDVLTYGIQIADALQEAHSKGIVHRDIKADNVMVNAKNQIKVMDFGLAKLKGTLKLTRTSSTVGTLAYMAPEQIQGGDVDHRSDIFSFGVVLFEMLTGKLPFRGDHEAAIMYSIVNEEPESAQRYKPEIPPELLHVLSRALEKDPADRYQSAQEMLIDFRRLQKQSTKVSRPSVAEMPVMSKETMQVPPGGTAPKKKMKPKVFLLALTSVVMILAAVMLYRLFMSRTGAKEPFRSIKMSRLTTSGKASRATISPDGRYVVHQVVEGEKKSLWMRQVATTSTLMIVPPADVTYRGITFSQDGNYVYYVAIDDHNPNGALFDIPVLGGTPRKVLSDLATAVTFSPDGKQLAFVRQYHAVGEEALMIVNVDGSGERKLASRKGDDFFVMESGCAPSWSPDGKRIAIGIGSNTGVQHVNVVAYDATSGEQQLLSKEEWGTLGRVMWAGDGGVALVGHKAGSTSNQVWHIQYPEGTIRGITNDLSDYDAGSIGVTSDASTLVATTDEVRSNIWVLQKNESGRDVWNSREAVQVTSGAATKDGVGGIDWTPDHKIIYTSRSNVNTGLSMMNSDGSDQRRLLPGTEHQWYPQVSADGRYIVYNSEKDTTPHIWRMDIDGGNPVRLSFAEDYYPSITPDGKSVLYSGWATGKILLYKVPLAGGDSVHLSWNPASSPRVSPDGNFIECVYFDETQLKWGNAVLALEGMSFRHFFILPNSVEKTTGNWYPDGKSITYIDTRNGVSNIWSMPVNGGEPKQITNFTSGLLFSYAWSQDGKYLAVARGDQTSDVVIIAENK